MLLRIAEKVEEGRSSGVMKNEKKARRETVPFVPFGKREVDERVAVSQFSGHALPPNDKNYAYLRRPHKTKLQALPSGPLIQVIQYPGVLVLTVTRLLWYAPSWCEENYRLADVRCDHKSGKSKPVMQIHVEQAWSLDLSCNSTSRVFSCGKALHIWA